MLSGIIKIVPTLQERLMYRGMGGEYMRQATAVLVEKCSLAMLPLHGNDILGEAVIYRISNHSYRISKHILF